MEQWAVSLLHECEGRRFADLVAKEYDGTIYSSFHWLPQAFSAMVNGSFGPYKEQLELQLYACAGEF